MGFRRLVHANSSKHSTRISSFNTSSDRCKTLNGKDIFTSTFATLSCLIFGGALYNMTFFFSMHEVKSGSTFLCQNVREQCQEDQRGVGTIQGSEAPELEVAGDGRV
jgi:hypothetical protein